MMQGTAPQVTNAPERLETARSIKTLAMVLAVYLLLVSGYIYTMSPTPDEGMFADPAGTLATEGYLGSKIADPHWAISPGVVRHTYYMPPLHFVLLAGWYKIFGFGIFSTRWLSALFGVGWLLAWYRLFLPSYGRRALWFVLALAVDGTFILASASGRMDMECAAFGFGALAVYLTLRSRNFERAVLWSWTLIALSGLTHPNGILYAIDLLLITFWLDRSRWSWRTAMRALLPLALAGLAWGLYILRDPADFLQQFLYNAAAAGRMSDVTSPLRSLYREITVRYGSAFGMDSPRSRASMFKAVILLGYVAGFVGAVTHRKLRARTGIGPLLIAGVVNALWLALLDGQKRGFYLIHVIPVLSAALVAWAIWTPKKSFARVGAILLLAASAIVQVTLHASRVRSDPYHREYLPAMSFIKNVSAGMKNVYIQPEHGFGLRFGPPMLHDQTFGYYSGRTPDMMVTTECYNGNLILAEALPADARRYVEQLFRGARLVYNERLVQVFIPQHPAK
jgi:4-amino-4-deoxy-L-arabinose transferase-like glycosyltransferase